MTYRGHMRNGVAVLDTPVDLPDGTPVRIEVERLDAAFWRNNGVAEIAQDQDVRALGSLDELAGDWPEEDSVDELLKLIREVRR